MIIAGHQPMYAPYLGYFYKIYKSDKFVFLNDVQFTRSNGVIHNGAAINRNKIKTPNGAQYITVPIEKFKFGSKINEIKISNNKKWKDKQLNILFSSYRRANFFEEVYGFFEQLIIENYEYIYNLNETVIIAICNKIGIHNSFYKSSDILLSTSSTERIINITKYLGGNTILSGTGAECYIDKKLVTAQSLNLKFTDYKPIIYCQLWGEYIPNMSVLDYLFNCGFKNPFIGF